MSQATIVNWNELFNNFERKNLKLKSFSYNENEYLEISILNVTSIVNLTFKEYISFRITDESNLMEYWDILENSTVNNTVFLKMENSSFIEEIRKLSKNFIVNSYSNINHYCIFLDDACIEVLTARLEPVIEKIPNYNGADL